MDYNNNQYNYNNANAAGPYEGERRGLGIAGVVCGIIGIGAAYLTGFMGVLFGAMAIVFGAFSKGGAKRMPVKGVVAIATGAAACAFGILMIVLAIYIMQANPGGIMDSLNEMMQGLTEFYSK